MDLNMAKPKLANIRSTILQVTFTPDEEQEVRDAADHMMMTVSSVLRWATLTHIRAGAKPQPKQRAPMREPVEA
jgi:hypothetical protein